MATIPDPVWVMAEQTEGEPAAVSLQLTGQARKLADELQTSVEVILLGEKATNCARRLFAFGADRVYVGDSPGLAVYQPEICTEMIVRLAQARHPQILLVGSTPMGRELAPLVAAWLGTGLTAHCIDLNLNDSNVLVARVPAYGGLLSIICPEKRPQMVIVAGGVFPLPHADETRTGEVVRLAVPDDVPRQIETLEIVVEAADVGLETASVVVAGGSGAGDYKGWCQIAELAQALGAALGSTRPAVDAGWTGLETMIGQSGKIVRPELYIGVGLSGEQQHLVGVVGARVMVAINTDPNAPVFDQVDYGIVDDCREFIPVLIAKIKEYRGV